ncbi:Lpxtg-domain-containing protein [Rutstroemia sp. NJR-2017a BBW]|nr:Lpxtg-domain-containing protein [Rutstroemia sp. NJR-2017a BBW]
MRPSLILAPSLFLLTSFLEPTNALKALSDSPCAVKCGNVLGGTTGEDDIVCDDSNYTSSIGTTFSSCVGCQLASSFVDPTTNETDLQWGLYNIRYAMSWCLWGYPNNPAVENTPCITSFSCGPFQNAVEYENLTTTSSEYGYCDDYNKVYEQDCSNCLSQLPVTYYLTNFFTLLGGACDQKPTPGSSLSFKGSPFSTVQLNMTSPTPSSAASNAYPGLSLNGRIGIAVGVILLILFISGFCIVCQGRRRRRRVLQKHQRETGYAAWKTAHDVDGLGGHIPVAEAYSATSNVSGGSFFDSPHSEMPLQPGYWGQVQPHVDNGPAVMTPMEESPVSAMGEKVYFSPYSSQYNSPATASTDGYGKSPNGDQWPMDRKNSFGSFGQGGGSMAEKLKMRERRRKMEEAEGERIELQNVAPVLSHPGHGRLGQRGLTSEDALKSNPT